MSIVVSIESPLGGGKGFFLKYLRQCKSIGTYSTNIILQDDAISHVMDMNNDFKRWALFTELDFLLKHVSSISNALKQPQKNIIVIEGSPLTDKTCYFDEMTIDTLEQELYEEWFDILKAFWKVDVYISLKSSIHSHYDRVMGNSKKEQSFVTLSYLAHKLQLYNNNLIGCPKIICENNFEDNEPVLQVMVEKFKKVIENILFKA